ncbi:MAG TPA: LuxR C-terminal-related transcriptional regulator [Terricaulis sp.]|nr:LuxR C-terminal-related transcriptional regulator [Terricaulis sp.]HRP11118.1 LuxR C-terminal-related transcriptional regulator [Terricaulis sp.]
MSAHAHVERARALLLEASIDPSRWEAALGCFARACGARTGQLIAMDRERQLVGHWLADAPDFLPQIEEFGFTDPKRNPRIRIGLSAPLGAAAADQDYLDADARQQFPIYAGLYERHDLPFNCQAVLMRDEQNFVRASITRTAAQGPLDAEAFRAFAALTPHLESAVRMHANLHSAAQSAALFTLDAVDAAAFVLNEAGLVIGLSAAAEKYVSPGAMMQLSSGRLRLQAPADQNMLEAAIERSRAALRDGYIVAHAPLVASGAPLVIDLQLLPRQQMSLSGAPAMLAIIRPVPAEDALRVMYGLTEAEGAVAVAVADGERLKDIAARRAVSVATVRSQVQAIYAKMDVHRQAELAAAVRRLGGEG